MPDMNNDRGLLKEGLENPELHSPPELFYEVFA